MISTSSLTSEQRRWADIMGLELDIARQTPTGNRPESEVKLSISYQDGNNSSQILVMDLRPSSKIHP